MTLALRLATQADDRAMRVLMNRAIAELLKPYLPPEGIAASFEVMGIDTQLIADKSYFVVTEHNTIIGCGGWSRRATLFGGDHTKGRDAALLDPTQDSARVRAMYTDPAHTRRGIGRMILDACEAAARAEGFTRVELAATLAGEPLYRAYGFELIEPITSRTSTGIEVPLLRMSKAL
ncbi:MAG TPA: GNAT family N-acetyltransferase [Verrucomicrobiae bacterium]|nr:GNAT family N-acetyltransferase [Verrucomicrobiae bacterium]